ncbi:Asparaginase 2 domain containing protein, partial [Asbolus verrucosus]
MSQQFISALDAVTVGCTACEENQCNYAVGFGGTPDESGETTLDAMIFDGYARGYIKKRDVLQNSHHFSATMDMGAVGGLRRIKSAMKVARGVLDYTTHSFIVGDLATEFAKKLKFPEESLSTNYSQSIWQDWESADCQPNFWRPTFFNSQNVEPDATKSCGPYEPIALTSYQADYSSSDSHDTIGMIAIDENGDVVAGTSTNGLIHKIAGRVGDSPIAGAGAYADNDVGAAVATGNGDLMMRFLPTFLAVEEMRRGASPAEAAKTAIGRIKEKYPNFYGALLVSSKDGEFAAACNGMDSFPFAVANKELGGVVLKTIDCNA